MIATRDIIGFSRVALPQRGGLLLPGALLLLSRP